MSFASIARYGRWRPGAVCISASADRAIPAFAPETIPRMVPAASTSCKDGGATAVMLWADTFNNHFMPRTAQAAVEVLEAAGYCVEVPNNLCCGRPLKTTGCLISASASSARSWRRCGRHFGWARRRDVVAAARPIRLTGWLHK